MKFTPKILATEISSISVMRFMAEKAQAISANLVPKKLYISILSKIYPTIDYYQYLLPKIEPEEFYHLE